MMSSSISIKSLEYSRIYKKSCTPEIYVATTEEENKIRWVPFSLEFR